MMRIAIALTTLALLSLPVPAEAREFRCMGRRATIVGTKGADRLVGSRGRDVIVGRGGNDTIVGRGSKDRICAGKGKDSRINQADRGPA